MAMDWVGVMPAITTCFGEDLSVDYEFLGRHCRWLVEHGCTGIVTPGSLGEGATLTREEKALLWKTCVRALGDRAPVIAAISALSTNEAVSLAVEAEKSGCRGLMVLPPYVYKGDWREIKEYISCVLRATHLPCMLYNNPVAYGTDFLPDAIWELAKENGNLEAVKESSTDVRRVTAIRALLGRQLKIFVGVDDAIVEGLGMGAVGWIAGLANALPDESVELYNLTVHGELEKAFALYRWFLPLLRMDTVPKFVQLIKLVQQEVGRGNARVRPPRLELVGEELEEVIRVIRQALRTRPSLAP